MFFFAVVVSFAISIFTRCYQDKDPYPKGIPSGQDDSCNAQGLCAFVPSLGLCPGYGMPCPYFVSLSFCRFF
jgi:hypothetical protein